MVLEVQAVAPPNARSWFMGENVVSGECRRLAVNSKLEYCCCRWEAPCNDADRPTVPSDTTTRSMQAGRVDRSVRWITLIPLL